MYKSMQQKTVPEKNAVWVSPNKRQLKEAKHPPSFFYAATKYVSISKGVS